MTHELDKLVALVREGGIKGHMAFDELASIANGQTKARPLLDSIETDIAEGKIILEPYPEDHQSSAKSLWESLLDLIPVGDRLPPDRW